MTENQTVPAAIVERAHRAIDWERHEYRVNRAGSPADWVPYCQCGWKADHSFDVASYDRHIATLVLEAVYADIQAEALRELRRETESERDHARNAHQSAANEATHLAHDYCRWVGHAEALTNQLNRIDRRADRLAGA